MKKMAITMAAVILGMAGIADAATDSNSIVQDGIEYYLHTNKSVYHLGEQVEMLYRVTNLRDEDVTFGFPHSPEWNFWVEKDGEYIWRAVNGWWTVMTQFTLGPGDSKQFPTFDPTCIWNMRDNENNLVNLGEYTVIGGLYAGSGYYDYTKVAVSIEIIPSTRLVPGEYATIQKAIDSAYNGDTVLVADGTYTGPGNRDIDFLGKAITVRSTNPNDPNIVAATIIDCNGTYIDLHRGFYFHSGEDANTILDGFTITNGFSVTGGAILCYNSSPVIRNNIIVGNAILYDFDGGGGITTKDGSPIITNNIIKGNTSVGGGGGGGIRCWGNGSPMIVNNIIRGNTAYNGGGIQCYDFSGSATIMDNIITDNAVNYGGAGIDFWGDGFVAIMNNTITGNTADAYGGGICSIGDISIINSTIRGNSALWEGGGIYCLEGNLAITNCTISGNSTKLGVGGGIICWRSNLTITNSAIIGNLVNGDGGGIYCDCSTMVLTNCTLAGNSSPNGDALACDSWLQAHPSNLQVTNCILADGGNEIWNNDNSVITVNYSDIQGGWPGEGNIGEDPCFVEPGYWDTNNTPDDANDDSWIDGDYHLLPDSLCIDAGDPNYIPEPNETDLDGQPRIIGGRIDMGAYETNYIQAAMKFTPQMLNCNSKGKYVKAHFVLPEGFLPEDVNVNKPAWAEPMGIESEYIKVLGSHKGQVKLEICFDREAFCEAITETGEVEITVIGSLTTSRYFYATDTIKMKPRRR